MQSHYKYFESAIKIYNTKKAIVFVVANGLCVHSVARVFAREYGLARLSIGDAIRMVLNNQAKTKLANQVQKHLNQGLTVPDELAIQCLEVAVMSLVCSTRG